MIPNVGPMELMIVVVIALVVLGPKKIPEAAKSLGAGVRGFKASLSGDEEAAPSVPRKATATETASRQ